MYSPATLDFIRDLKNNNNKDWFDAHRKQYEAAKKDHLAVTDTLLRRIEEFEPAMQGLQAKDCVFRIFRDVRFAKDKSPYKDHFGAAMAPGGRKSPRGVYYLHVQPGSSFIAGGVYMPEAAHLKAIRQEIDYNLKEFEKLLDAPAFTKAYPGGLEAGEHMLSRPPKDYAKDNPAIEYLKRKSFIVSAPLTDKELTSPDMADRLMELCRALHPLNSFLDRALEVEQA